MIDFTEAAAKIYPDQAPAVDHEESNASAHTTGDDARAEALYGEWSRQHLDTEQEDGAKRPGDPRGTTTAEDAARAGEPITLMDLAMADANLAADLENFMEDHGIPEEKLPALRDMHEKARESHAKAFWGGTPEDWRRESLANPIIKSNVPGIQSLLRASDAGRDFAKFLGKTRLGDHPKVLRFLAEVAHDRERRRSWED